MRIRITRDTVALGRVVIRGEVLDESVGLEANDAATLIRLGKAVEIPLTAPGAAVEPNPAAPGAVTTETAAALVRGKKKTKAPTGLSKHPAGTM